MTTPREPKATLPIRGLRANALAAVAMPLHALLRTLLLITGRLSAHPLRAPRSTTTHRPHRDPR
jgi:hypothetical protein